MRIRKAPALGLAALVAGGLFAGGAGAQAQATGGSPAPCEPTAKACVSLSTNQAWLQEDGRTSYGPVPTTSGKPGAETPQGTFQVQWKNADHVSGEFGAPMPNAVFFTDTGVAFHEGSLEQESNGCIHLSTTASKTFFDSLQPGDEVQVVP
ncbi:L,D-transpeptidase [Saccharopolyspora sp. HNM0983]|uniref:L,D-transpeptidase n=1 Tax=Saccharopolyspora montiporae TaxID=2781240 RepID=A0A929B8G0_9PSEU|nr:L,D-transpeptidase [Saccharopolyspora sp. HNM0983]MBE9375179.1 L,D-transpeptidase [Saccharopolyspora sp. HNM0983]